MNRKSPSAQECDFKIKFKDVKSGQVLKFSYGESGKEFLMNSKFKKAIFMQVNSILPFKGEIYIKFSKKMVRRAELPIDQAEVHLNRE